jgi:Adaptive response protein AidB N-terminal domain
LEQCRWVVVAGAKPIATNWWLRDAFGRSSIPWMPFMPEAVFNQSPPLENYNLFDSDCALKEAVRREGGGWIDAEAGKLGELLGKPETINLGVYWQTGLPRS